MQRISESCRVFCWLALFFVTSSISALAPQGTISRRGIIEFAGGISFVTLGSPARAEEDFSSRAVEVVATGDAKVSASL